MPVGSMSMCHVRASEFHVWLPPGGSVAAETGFPSPCGTARLSFPGIVLTGIWGNESAQESSLDLSAPKIFQLKNKKNWNHPWLFIIWWAPAGTRLENVHVSFWLTHQLHVISESKPEARLSPLLGELEMNPKASKMFQKVHGKWN